MHLFPPSIAPMMQQEDFARQQTKLILVLKATNVWEHKQPVYFPGDGPTQPPGSSEFLPHRRHHNAYFHSSR